MWTELYLIRHGESVANVSPVVGGPDGDVGLTDLGRQQVRLLGERLSQEQFRADVLYASTLPRAQQTVEPVAEALRLPVHNDDELQELRPGAADGLSLDQWQQRWPGMDRGPAALPFQRFADGGESWAEFLARTGAALTRLVGDYPDQTVVAVCHGGVIEASFYLAFALGASGNRAAFAPDNTGITHWRYRPRQDGRPEWTLVAFNDVHHLDRMPAPAPQSVPTPAEADTSAGQD